MNATRLTLLIALLSVSKQPICAQQADWQNKNVSHVMVALDSNWFLATWQIANLRKSSPGNFNAIAGIGYQEGGTWVEIMAQRQWGKKNLWYMDMRSQTPIGKKASLFTEVAPALQQHQVYNAIIYDQKWAKGSRLIWGIESENIFKKPRNLLGAGPRLSWILWQSAKNKLTTTASYEFRLHDRNFGRLYFVYQTKR